MSLRKPSATEQDNQTTEVSYINEQLELEDVEDILERLHVGTLRREQLKQRKSVLNSEDPEPLDDKLLEDIYNNNGSNNSVLKRTDSRISSSSLGSTASSSSYSDLQLSRQGSVSSRSVDTSDMGVQTTLARPTKSIPEESSSASKLQDRKKRKKDKMKKLFRRKSTASSSSDGSLSSLVDLPQGFIVKYMGKRTTKGLWGSKHTRVHVEDIVDSIGKLPKGEDLPLVNLEVHPQGLAMHPHSKNKIQSFKPVQIPIQFISYGLQDTVYPRIFCFIMVTEMSSQKKSAECHVYACDSADSARDLACCLAMAFHAHSEQLNGGAVKFNVNLDMNTDESGSTTCDV